MYVYKELTLKDRLFGLYYMGEWVVGLLATVGREMPKLILESLLHDRDAEIARIKAADLFIQKARSEGHSYGHIMDLLRERDLGNPRKEWGR